MNKKILLLIVSIIFITGIFAQRTPPTYTSDEGAKGFKKENIFIGGGITLGFASNTFQIGASPEIGYSIAQWLDAGLGFNLNYASQSADPYYNNNVRYHNFNYGGGPFVRLFPLRFLFIQGQLEENWIKVNAKDYNTGYSNEVTYQSTSFIAGIGYAQRIVGQSSFYTMLALDLMRDPNSPYRDYNNAAIPIIRAGFNFYLRPSRRK
ncbi:MAG TPA: hypothetical protein VN958_12715 [Chitinophagaceae bacterium]|nr:hypothetical protein [Chitinophagaceae bacterium]